MSLRKLKLTVNNIRTYVHGNMYTFSYAYNVNFTHTKYIHKNTA